MLSHRGIAGGFENGIDAVLARWTASSWVKPCLCVDETLGPAAADYLAFPSWLAPGVVRGLRRRGVERLYSHQARAIRAAQSQHHVVIATPTASGKSLCFHIPVLQAMAEDPDARALYLYPTKALARDQEADLLDLLREAGLPTLAVVYDGDTPADARRAARERARIVLTNPDMLHTGILPHHPSWARTLRSLRYVVIDEMHTYKGVFGSHMANVLRRLLRVAAFHGSQPRIVGATATIANPREHAARLFGTSENDIAVVGESGAPRGTRRFFLYNPPVVNQELGIRASYVKQAVMLAADLARARVPTIVFGQSRNSVEVMLRYLRDAVCTGPSRTDRGAGIDPDRIVAYRGGYLPAQRREIERKLREGEIVCVVATNALELGIDIGELDAVVCAGYPGSVAATWQRFGRAGRRGSQSICVLVASSAPLDQYLAREPQFLLGAPVEEARIDPDNVEILVQHVKCAAFELSFTRGESFGSLGPEATNEALGLLVRHRVLHESAGAYHWATEAFPANNVSLRSVGWDNVVIIDVESERSIAELDWRSAQTMLHEQAIYQHSGECWQVERFDHQNHKAFVRRVEPDYWTDAMTNVQIAIIEESAEGPASHSHWPSGWGEVSIAEKVVGYKKIKFYTHENAGYGEVRLPEMEMHTTAFWVTLPERTFAAVAAGPSAAIDALRGIGAALEIVATIAMMCDPRDLGTALGNLVRVSPISPMLVGGTGAAPPPTPPAEPCRAQWNGALAVAAGGHSRGKAPPYSPTLFLHEHVPGGTGLAERIWQQRDMLFARVLRMIEKCPCAAGCPSCVGPGELSRKTVALELLRTASNEGTSCWP